MHLDNFSGSGANPGRHFAKAFSCAALGMAMLGPSWLAVAQTNPNPATLPTTASTVTTPFPLILSTPPTSTLINAPVAEQLKLVDKAAEKLIEKKDDPTPHIALIIPLHSKAFGAVADAIKQGFIAAANVDGKQATPYRIYARDDESASLGTQYRKAVQDGAIAIIGGVTRDGTNLMVKEAGYIPTLALNAPTETDLPDRFFYISLNLDAEARSVAREALLAGLHNVAVLTSATALSKRIQDSFEKEWIRLGGTVTESITFTGDIADASRLKKALGKAREKSQADFVFIAADVKAARLARPFIPVGMPVFATSHALDARAGAVENLDLDSVRFLEMPWFVEKDHPAVMAYAKPLAPMPLDYERLYALGIDAWRVMQSILKADKPRNIMPLDGVTGRLNLEGAQFVRTLTAIEMRDGLPQLLQPSPPLQISPTN